MRYALAASALAIVATLAGVAVDASKPSPPAAPIAGAPVYALHGFDLHGDGYPVTIDTGLSLPDCEKLSTIATAQQSGYFFTCRG